MYEREKGVEEGGRGARLLPVFLKLMCDINAPLESRDMTSSVKMLTGPKNGWV
jgi:hypothetical protein